MPDDGTTDRIINIKLEQAIAAVNSFIDEKHTPHIALEMSQSFIRSLSFTADNYLESKAKTDEKHKKRFDELMVKRESFINIKPENRKQDYSTYKKFADEICREYDALLVLTDIKK
jgi:hypothetical protein